MNLDSYSWPAKRASIRDDTSKSSEIDSWPGHQCGQSDDEVQRLKNHMGGAGYQFGPQARSYRGLMAGSGPGNDAIGFAIGGNNFFGYAFDSGGATLYGWARISLESLGGGMGRVSIEEWAYEDSGAAIAVGDTGPAGIDEPHSLALLALGAGGLAAWRRRRRGGERAAA